MIPCGAMKLPSIIKSPIFAALLFLAVAPAFPAVAANPSAAVPALAADARIRSGETLADVLASHTAPSADFLLGDWRYNDNVFVCFKDAGETPDKSVADSNLALMTVNPENCELVFLDGKTCTFRVGNMKFKLVWKLNEETREFTASVAFFTVKGYLVREGDRLALIYSKANLFMMMRFLCPLSTHKYIRDLSSAMDITDGLSLCILFSK